MIFKSKDIMSRKVFSNSGYRDNIQTCLQEILFHCQRERKMDAFIPQSLTIFNHFNLETKKFSPGEIKFSRLMPVEDRQP